MQWFKIQSFVDVKGQYTACDSERNGTFSVFSIGLGKTIRQNSPSQNGYIFSLSEEWSIDLVEFKSYPTVVH